MPSTRPRSPSPRRPPHSETAQRERNEKAGALDDVLRLADSKRVADLVAEADQLWPLVPEKAADMKAWIVRTKYVLARRGDHQERLAAIREKALPYTEEAKAKDHEADRKAIEAGRKRLEDIEAAKAKVEGDEAEAKKKALDEQAEAVRKEVARLEAGLGERRSWAFEDPQADWQHQVLLDLLAGFDRLDGGGKEGDGGFLSDITKRHDFVTSLRKRSIEDYAKAWEETIAAIAASPKYGGLEIKPRLGLVPLGPDPDSGLFEFAHLGSGSIPTRGEKGYLVQEEERCTRTRPESWRGLQDGRTATGSGGCQLRSSGPGRRVTRPRGDTLALLGIQVRVHAVAVGCDDCRTRPQRIQGRPDDRRQDDHGEKPRGTSLMGRLRGQARLARAQPARAAHRGAVGVRMPGRDGLALDHGPRSRRVGEGRQHRGQVLQRARRSFVLAVHHGGG